MPLPDLDKITAGLSKTWLAAGIARRSQSVTFRRAPTTRSADLDRRVQHALVTHRAHAAPEAKRVPQPDVGA